MRLGALAAVGVSADSIISLGKVLSFTVDIVLLTKDAGMHAGKTACSATFSALPPETARNILEKYHDLHSKANVLRMRYNVPDFPDMHDAAERHFKVVKKVAADLNERFEYMLQPAQNSFAKYLGEFKSSYPESPEIPEGLLDRIFVLFLLGFLYTKFFSYVWSLFAMAYRVLRCMCCPRSAGTKRPGRYSEKKKSK